MHSPKNFYFLLLVQKRRIKIYTLWFFVIFWLLKSINRIMNFNINVLFIRYVYWIYHSQVLCNTNPNDMTMWDYLCSIKIENKRKLHNWIFKCKMSISIFIVFNPSSQTMMCSCMFICQVGCLVLILHRNVIYFRFYI